MAWDAVKLVAFVSVLVAISVYLPLLNNLVPLWGKTLVVITLCVIGPWHPLLAVLGALTVLLTVIVVVLRISILPWLARVWAVGPRHALQTLRTSKAVRALQTPARVDHSSQLK